MALPRRTPLRRTRINPVSAKARARRPDRAAARAVVLERGRCEAGPLWEQLLHHLPTGPDELAARDVGGLLDAWRHCGGWAAGVVHEPGSRSRDIGSQYDPSRAMLCCEACHEWGHAHPTMARLAGVRR